MPILLKGQVICAINIEIGKNYLCHQLLSQLLIYCSSNNI